MDCRVCRYSLPKSIWIEPLSSTDWVCAVKNMSNTMQTAAFFNGMGEKRSWSPPTPPKVLLPGIGGETFGVKLFLGRRELMKMPWKQGDGSCVDAAAREVHQQSHHEEIQFPSADGFWKPRYAAGVWGLCGRNKTRKLQWRIGEGFEESCADSGIFEVHIPK